jgi:ABC-type amino acid transport substrate-binding protein
MYIIIIYFMNKIIVLLIVVLVIATLAYVLMSPKDELRVNPDSEIQYYDDGQPVVYCDEAGNRYATVAEAKSVGLIDAEFGATYCPENSTTVVADYIGMSVEAAQAKAQAEGVLFRVVIQDGQALPTTRDIQEGRINATIVDGMVTAYDVESAKVVDEQIDVTASSSVEAFVGMTEAGAEEYASTNNIMFRVVMRDGESLPATMDLRPGRINAVVTGGVVVSYTVE